MGANDARRHEPIAAALFGAARQGVLRLLFGHADERFFQRQIVRDVGLGSGAVQRELKRLERCGLLIRSVEGRQTYYQANRESPVFEELRGLIRKTFGVADVVRTALAPLAGGIRLAFIYGSIAKGEERLESDVDLLVVAEAIGLGDVVKALRDAQRDLRREVNPTVYRTKEFCRKLAEGHHFVANAVAGPKIFVVGDESELARLGEIGVAEAASTDSGRNRRVVRPRRSRS
jgi:predicted nucleotidyltransferase